MSERKRRRLDEDARRLELCAADLRELGASIGACAFRAPSAHVTVPLQRSRAAPRPTTAAAHQAPRSLYSVVSSAAHAARTSAQSRQETWQAALQRLAAELDAPRAQQEAADRCARLRRRFEALHEAVRLRQDALRRAGDELALQDRVESQLAQEETAWEQQMQAREQRVAEREVELQALQEERGQEARVKQEQEQEGADAETEEEEEEDAQQEARVERAELREALALRAEEKRDIQAAIDSLQRERARRRAALAEQRTRRQEEQTENVQVDAAAAARQQVLRELRDEKEALQSAIIAAEEVEEKLEENARDLPALKDELQRAKAARAHVQARVDSLRLELARRKRKMRHMVDVQLLTARDTNPPTLREEAVLLHLLYEHEGEMGVNELKQEASAVLKEHAKPNGNGVVIRALYSLVANGVVQIDRSYGNGLVTSLLV
ncbi:Translation initiation factor eIF-3 subunit 10 [Phytophthora cinnamomi]|uniref:Translation initiation factor eIF-3 subunit 10 n=1 Tax=Phytophthora cinnamomi TaxID=4785 RepID=UPI00355A60C2|nr:Translation initiation factor eIF-3 subunit 10 [Phytophthora cinnamomi]